MDKSIEHGGGRKKSFGRGFDFMMYNVDDIPPWYYTILLSLQHYMTMVGSTLVIPILLAGPLCIGDNPLVLSEIISTVFLISGIATIVQSCVGTRLPIVQGATVAFLGPTISILNLPKYKCNNPSIVSILSNSTGALNSTFNSLLVNSTILPFLFNSTIDPLLLNSIISNITLSNSTLLNTTTTSTTTTTTTPTTTTFTTSTTTAAPLLMVEQHDWRVGMREIQGSIMLASLFQVVIGMTGIIGFLMRFIGPLTIAPTVSLVGLALFESTGDFAGKQWGIAALTVLCVILFSQVLGHRFSFFNLFPVILAIFTAWSVSAIITIAGGFPEDSPARTDKRISVVYEAEWIRVPYPGQWGMPTAHVAGVFGMMAGVFASMIESIGDYYACARIAGVPPPPKHSVNRGILCEGLCCILAGAFGSGNGTTSYSENIAAMGITRVASRRVVQVSGVIMILLSILGKFGAIFTLIPDPVIGGMLWSLFGFIIAVGLSNLQFVNLNSSRNLFVLGFALFNGMVVPTWIVKNQEAINTGIEEIDQVLFVLLKTNMAVGGLTAAIFDNLLPGSKEDRGLYAWKSMQGFDGSACRTYDLPYIQGFLDRHSWVKYIPFLPHNKQRKISRSSELQNFDLQSDEIAI